jgi:hypothetical protein
MNPTEISNRELIITFEDLKERGKPLGPLPTGYAGCTWCESAWFLTKACHPSACMKGQVSLLNADGSDVGFERPEPFWLKSLSLSLLWEGKSDVVLEGWTQGVMKYSRTVTIPRSTAIQFEPDYRGIDRVNLRTGGAHVVVDNITLGLD